MARWVRNNRELNVRDSFNSIALLCCILLCRIFTSNRPEEIRQIRQRGRHAYRLSHG